MSVDSNNTLSGRSIKGFIFSIDAFVAFLIAMSMIYSLIFLSSVVTSRSEVMLQMHTIADDAMVALISTKKGIGTNLDYVASGNTNLLDDVVPKTYNYQVEVRKNGVWTTVGHRRGTSRVLFGKVVSYGYSVSTEGKKSGIHTYKDDPYIYASCGNQEGAKAGSGIGLPCSAPGYYAMPDSVEPVAVKITIWK